MIKQVKSLKINGEILKIIENRNLIISELQVFLITLKLH